MNALNPLDPMLNLSDNSIDGRIDTQPYGAFGLLKSRYTNAWLQRLLAIGFLVLVAFAFLPWTQNIQSTGQITMLRPDQRPQTVPSAIPGRIEQWYVSEGQYVQAGDTLVRLSEVKSEYTDPELLERTREQLAAKQAGVIAYDNKVTALAAQFDAISQARDFKLAAAANKTIQARLKVTTDSAAIVAAQLDLEVALAQLERQRTLYEQGLKSLVDLESRRMKAQSAEAKMTKAFNDLDYSRNELENALIEQSTLASEFADKLAKVSSERFSAESAGAEARGEVAKLRNTLANYEARAGFRYLRAPQSGRVTQALSMGIGETVKEGTPILTIVPDETALAVEFFVEPMDLPLIHVGNEVRFLFDGWPAIVFSGWPAVTYGTFPGEIVAIDPVISANGKYRVLVAERIAQPWPEALRAGGGARGIALLETVPIWYEVWRQLNGFPPDYYTGNDTESSKSKKP